MTTSATPAILIVADKHRGVLVGEFGRYLRDYHVQCVPTALEAIGTLSGFVGGGRPVAMIVIDAEVPDMGIHEAISAFRTIVPTAKRVVGVDWESYYELAPKLRHALRAGKFDAQLLIPRGARDEEFHYAITELLSDWGATVPVPEVDVVRIICPSRVGLSLQIRDFLDRMGMPNRTYAPDSPEGLAAAGHLDAEPAYPLVHSLNSSAQCPVIAATSVRSVAELLFGRPSDVEEESVVDVVVVGAGPAGLAGAVYAASEGLSTVVIESEAVGGQAGTSSMIRNYLGFPRGISGMRLAQRARNQAIRFGARFYTGWAVDRLTLGVDGAPHCVQTEGGTVRARSVLISTGVAYRRLGVDAVERLVGSGVHYGAAMSAAREMEGRDVYIVGGGNSAGQAAIHLARFARSVTILIRRKELSDTMSSYLIDEINYHPRVTVRNTCEVVDGGGEGTLQWLTLRNRNTGNEDRVSAGGLFLFIGAEPRCDWLPTEVERDDRGFVRTGRAVAREFWTDDLPPPELATSVRGIFAAGDIRDGSMKRVASASGEGASAVPLIHEWLAELSRIQA